MNRFARRIALASLLSAAPLPAAARQPFVRASVDTRPPIIAGQAVRINVSVLVPNYFTGSPDFPAIDLENAIVVLPNERPTHSTETIGDQGFAGISVSYVVYPQQAGSFRFPPAKIHVRYAASPPASVEADLDIPPVSFTASIPPEAEGLDYFLPSTSLTITERYDKPLTDLKVGDTFTRTVTISAANLRAMLIPPVDFGHFDGLSIYSNEPKVDDLKTATGEFKGGTRVESVTYLIRKPGDYSLPPVEIKWWNLTRRKIETATLLPVRFAAAPGAEQLTEFSPEAPPPPVASSKDLHPVRRYGRIALIALAILLGGGSVLWLLLRFGSRLRHRWAHARLEHQNSEKTHFRLLIRASRAQHPRETYAHLMTWRSRVAPREPLDQFVSQSADSEVQLQVGLLSRQLYGSQTSGEWSGKSMADALIRWRKQKAAAKLAKSALPPLNPVRFNQLAGSNRSQSSTSC